MPNFGTWMEQFDWRNGPIASNIAWPLTGSALYLVAVAVLTLRLKNADAATVAAWKANKTKSRLFALHNLGLSLASLIMFATEVWAVWSRTAAEGSIGWAFCEHLTTPPKGLLFGSAYLYYLSKYWEFADTLLALDKGSMPPHMFLHVFHHALVPIMAWLWLETSQSLHSFGLLFNTFVHVVMYYYYYLITEYPGIKVPWKRAITFLQNIQFITSFVLFSITLKMVLIDGAQCAGMTALYFNGSFNAVLLIQFAQVLFPSKKKPTGTADPAAVKKTN